MHSKDPKLQSTRQPELRAAWLALETDYLDRAVKRATPYLNANDPKLSANAMKIVALVCFRRANYAKACALFQEAAAVLDDAESWFNVTTSATLAGDIETGRIAFKRAVAARKRSPSNDAPSIPLMQQWYACALRDQKQYQLALDQINELRSYYEQLHITDDTFLYIRGVPSLSNTMKVAADIFRSLGTSFDWEPWIDSLAKKLDDDGRAYLEGIKEDLTHSDG